MRAALFLFAATVVVGACSSDIVNVEDDGSGGSASGSQAGVGTGTESGAASGTETGTPAGTETGAPTGTPAGTGTGTGTGSPPGAQPPPPPPNGVPGDGPGYAFVIDAMFVGDTDWMGAPNPTAWQQFGYDVDGLVSTASSTDLCQPAAGGSPNAVYPDGPMGIDNAWGKLLLPIWTGLAQDYSSQVNATIDAGGANFLIEVAALGQQADYVGLTARFFQGGVLTSPPAFDGSDTWPISTQSLNDPNDPTSAKWLYADSYVNDHTLVLSPKSAVQLNLPLFLDAPSAINIYGAQITMQMAPDRSQAAYGIISGVIDVEEHIAILQQVAGSFDPGLCSGTTFDSLADQLRQSADILVDGTQDPSQTCNGFSIGLGFTASAVNLGGVVAPPPPPADPCP